jgi:hypothetical protein
MIHIRAYIQNTLNALRSFSKALFVVLLIIAPMTGIEVICKDSAAQLSNAVSRHPLSLTLFQGFGWLLLVGALVCAVRFLIASVQKWLNDEFYLTPYARMMTWTIICEFIAGENVFLIFLNYWKHH